MKSLRFMLLASFAMFSTVLFAQENPQKTDSIKVSGECGMCKSRIEKALKHEGITAANWDDETKILVVTYDSTKITNDDIQKKVAVVGHDTEKYKADDKVYKKLPGCCLYDRKP